MALGKSFVTLTRSDDKSNRQKRKKKPHTKQSMVNSQGNRKRIEHSGNGWVSFVEILIRKKTAKEGSRLSESWV